MEEIAIRINEEIKAAEVLVLNEEGAKLGVFKLKEALQMAEQADKDLIEITGVAIPPVCKIIEYGKYKYQTDKKKKADRKKQKVSEIKEIKLHLNIASHDLEVKLNNIKQLLKEGHKVRISLLFRGREINFLQSGYKLFDDIKEGLTGAGKYEMPPKQEGNRLKAIAAPI